MQAEAGDVQPALQRMLLQDSSWCHFCHACTHACWGLTHKPPSAIAEAAAVAALRSSGLVGLDGRCMHGSAWPAWLPCTTAACQHGACKVQRRCHCVASRLQSQRLTPCASDAKRCFLSGKASCDNATMAVLRPSANETPAQQLQQCLLQSALPAWLPPSLPQQPPTARAGKNVEGAHACRPPPTPRRPTANCRLCARAPRACICTHMHMRRPTYPAPAHLHPPSSTSSTSRLEDEGDERLATGWVRRKRAPVPRVVRERARYEGGHAKKPPRQRGVRPTRKAVSAPLQTFAQIIWA